MDFIHLLFFDSIFFTTTILLK